MRKNGMEKRIRRIMRKTTYYKSRRNSTIKEIFYVTSGVSLWSNERIYSSQQHPNVVIGHMDKTCDYYGVEVVVVNGY